MKIFSSKNVLWGVIFLSILLVSIANYYFISEKDKFEKKFRLENNALLERINNLENELDDYKPDLDSKKIENIVNDYRESIGLNRLKESWVVCGMAEQRVKEVSVDFSHDGFNSDKIKYTQTAFQHFGENLSKDFSNEKDNLTEWIKSDSHRKNMEDKNFEYGCIKCYKNFCAHIFAGF